MSELLKKARELCEKATPGPWNNGMAMFGDSGDYSTLGLPTHKLMPDMFLLNDAVFIEHSRALIPQLCDRIEKLEESLNRIYKIETQGCPDYVTNLADRLRWIAREALNPVGEK